MPRDEWTPPRLDDRIALVTGASRGVGLGIAEVLGQCGATVIVTARSHKGHTTENLPGSVESAAEAVTRAGGKGIAIRCDHTDDDAVAALFARIESEHGRLDLLVNNAWGGYESYEHDHFSAPFWEQPLEIWRRMFDAGVRTHFTASRLAAPMMIAKKKGLIVSTSSGDGAKYRGSFVYDAAKVTIERMAWSMARELHPHGVAALALQPGFTRTERVLDAFEHDMNRPELADTHSPAYVGRAVAHLLADVDIMAQTGKTLMVGNVAKAYGFTDTDGRYVPAFILPPEYD